MKNSTVKEIKGQHGLECLSIQVSIHVESFFMYLVYTDCTFYKIAHIYS